MGGQFQPCRNILSTDYSQQKLNHQRNVFHHNKNNSGQRSKLCISENSPSNHNNNLYININESQKILKTQTKRKDPNRLSTSNISPQIRQSRSNISTKRRKIAVDGSTIKRRQALGRTLAEKLGLDMTSDRPISKQQQQRRLILKDIIQVICVNNQQHLIDIIDQMANRLRTSTALSSVNFQNRLQRFLDSVNKADIESLDMLFHNDQELYGPTNYKLRFNRNIFENIVDIKQMMMEQKQFPGSVHLNYQKLKKQGLKMIRNGKVCFFILAGGKSSRFLVSSVNQESSCNNSNPNTHRSFQKSNLKEGGKKSGKQFEPLNIPSQRSIMELIIHRFLALSQLLSCKVTIYLGVSQEKVNDLKKLCSNLEIDERRLTIYPFTHKQIGALDYQGKLVVEDDQQASLWSIGTGDMWNILRGDKQLTFPNVVQLQEQGFQYIQVLGVSNVLEKCFDCLSLGLAKESDLDWTTKIVQSYSKKHPKSSRNFKQQFQNIQTKIYINNDNEIYICDPQQIQNYPSQCRYTFMNHSLFKLKYLEKILFSTELDHFWPRKKVHLTSNIPPFSKYRTVISYQKDYTDIFRLATKQEYVHDGCGAFGEQISAQYVPKWKLILCDQGDYYPLIYNKGNHSDIQSASKALTDLHKAYLGIENNECRIQIDPYVSLEGERLEQLKKDLQGQTFTEEDWIFIQHH